MQRWPRIEREELAGITLMLVAVFVTVYRADGTAARLVTAVAMVAAEIGLLTARHAPLRTHGWALGGTIVVGFVAMLVAPNGLAEVPILVAASRLPRVLPRTWTDPVSLVVSLLFGLGVAWISRNAVGLLAGVGVWLLVQRTVQSDALQAERDRAVALLAEVQASRDAQAVAAAAGERARIARDMHDVLAHSLAGLSLQLQAARAVAVREGVGDAVTGPLQRAADLAREGVAEARAAVGALTGNSTGGVAMVEGEPGIDEVSGMVARFPGRASLALTGTPQPIAAAAGRAVYRAVQESLTNAARYAPGAPVSVAFDWFATHLVATVSDEGSTRPDADEPLAAAGVSGPTGTGAGLIGMSERLDQVGGRLVAGPVGNGWVVRILVPTSAGVS